jgi:DNA-binding MltR family transcriptional regulator
LIALSEQEEEALFERDAPLSSFSKLIRVAYAFGIIDHDLRRNCDYVREIRNAFAHSPTTVKFESAEIRTVCNLLTQYFNELEDLPFPKDHPRSKFLNTATRLMMVFGQGKSLTSPKQRMLTFR